MTSGEVTVGLSLNGPTSNKHAGDFPTHGVIGQSGTNLDKAAPQTYAPMLEYIVAVIVVLGVVLVIRGCKK